MGDIIYNSKILNSEIDQLTNVFLKLVFHDWKHIDYGIPRQERRDNCEYFNIINKERKRNIMTITLVSLFQ